MEEEDTVAEVLPGPETLLLRPVKIHLVWLNAAWEWHKSSFLYIKVSSRKSTCLCLHRGYRDGHTLSSLSVCHTESCHGSLFWHLTGGVTWCQETPSTFHDTHCIRLITPVMQRLGVDKTAGRIGKEQHFYQPLYDFFSKLTHLSEDVSKHVCY